MRPVRAAGAHDGRPVPSVAVLGVHHHPLHGAAAACGHQALPWHAAQHLRDGKREGNNSSPASLVMIQVCAFGCL